MQTLHRPTSRTFHPSFSKILYILSLTLLIIESGAQANEIQFPKLLFRQGEVYSPPTTVTTLRNRPLGEWSKDGANNSVEGETASVCERGGWKEGLEIVWTL
jgi:hypothetical protein